MRVTGIDPGNFREEPKRSWPTGEFILIDVRTAEEYVGFHVPGALNVPYDEIDGEIPAIRRGRQAVVVYSSCGRRSRIAAAKLAAARIPVFDAGTREKAGALIRDSGQA
jgi:rhodanese-related sulfurtransferase